MFWALAVILMAFAVFSVLVIRRRRPRAPQPSAGFDAEQLKGFVYVGAAVLVLVSVGVIILGLVNPTSGRAEAIAVLGFFGYALYLLASAGALYLMARYESRT